MSRKYKILEPEQAEAGFVSSLEDYLYSSVRDYAGEQGLKKIILIN